jgi:hypothetical protein
MRGDLANISRLNRVCNDFILRQILLKLACEQTGTTKSGYARVGATPL